MKTEEIKKIRLLDKNENILCSLEALYIYDKDSDDEGEYFYIHPMTGNYVEFVDMCFQGWSEQDEADNINWRKLVECIENDDDLLNKFYYLDEIDYFL